MLKENDTVFGRYIFINGYVYEGHMKNHKMHGDGKLMKGRKTVYKGEFEFGEQVEDKITLASTTDNITVSLPYKQYLISDL